MYFLMICTHKENADAARDAVRPEHRAYVASGGEGRAKVLVGSAITDSAATAGIGNFGILEANSEADARAFAENDPFAKAGIVTDIKLIRLADGFQAHRIDPMSQ